MVIDDLRSKLVEFQKTGEAYKLGVLRYFLAQLKNKEIELRPQKQELTDEVAFKILRKLIKDRREMIELYKKADKAEQLKKEEDEMKVLEEFAAYFPFKLEFGPPANFVRPTK